MKTKFEILESIHDSLLEEKLRLEIAVRNLADRSDDDVVVPRLSPFNMDGQKTKKELVAEYQERIEKVGHAILATEKFTKEEHDKTESGFAPKCSS